MAKGKGASLPSLEGGPVPLLQIRCVCMCVRACLGWVLPAR